MARQAEGVRVCVCVVCVCCVCAHMCSHAHTCRCACLCYHSCPCVLTVNARTSGSTRSLWSGRSTTPWRTSARRSCMLSWNERYADHMTVTRKEMHMLTHTKLWETWCVTAPHHTHTPHPHSVPGGPPGPGGPGGPGGPAAPLVLAPAM